jgi:hypothetical protein
MLSSIAASIQYICKIYRDYFSAADELEYADPQNWLIQVHYKRSPAVIVCSGEILPSLG